MRTPETKRFANRKHSNASARHGTLADQTGPKIQKPRDTDTSAKLEKPKVFFNRVQSAPVLVGFGSVLVQSSSGPVQLWSSLVQCDAGLVRSSSDPVLLQHGPVLIRSGLVQSVLVRCGSGPFWSCSGSLRLVQSRLVVMVAGICNTMFYSIKLL